MAKPTVQAVYDQVRSLLGDDQIVGGEVFTNAVLQPHYGVAYRTLYRTMAILGNPYIERDVYYTLPPNTTFLDPATVGITDLGEPLFIDWRSGLTTVAITGALVSAVLVTVTAPGHGYASGDMPVIGGIVGIVGTDGIWGITVLDANTFTLNGCIATGVYVSGGTATKGGGRFFPMKAVDRFDDIGTVTNDYAYTWQQDVFGFRPNAIAVELRITYSASGNPPLLTSAIIGIDDSLDYLATHTAGMAIASRGGEHMANELIIRALGQLKSEENPGGLLLSFLRNEIKRVQRIPPSMRRRQAFRRRLTNNNTFEVY